MQYLGTAARQVQRDGLGVSLTAYPSRQRQTWHRHENATMFILLRGEFCDESPALGSRVLAPLTAVFHPAGAVHRGNAGDMGRVGINLEPTAAWMERQGISPKDLGGYRYTLDPHETITLVRLALQGDALTESIALECLLAPHEEPKSESNAWLQRGYRRVVETPDWTLQSLAQELCVHPVYLARVFRQRYGMSVTQHIRRSRLIHATRLASGGDVSLAEAAIEFGYADHAHFTRHFREEFGATPSDFLRIAKGCKSSSIC